MRTMIYYDPEDDVLVLVQKSFNFWWYEKLNAGNYYRSFAYYTPKQLDYEFIGYL